MSLRTFSAAATGALLLLLGVSYWAADASTFPAVAWTFLATFLGAAVGAVLLKVLRGSPTSMMAATLGRSAVSVLGVVLVWLLMEPAVKPMLGAFVIGYVLFLALETALAWSLNQSASG